MEKNVKKWLIEAVIATLFLGVFVVPFFGFANDGRDIYVDDDASGEEDGSSSHPYKTIWQAIEKSEDGDTILVAKGTYKENITIPKGVSVIGAGKGKTTIKSDDHDDSVVNMKDHTKLWGVTVKNGKTGIYVRENARVKISDSEIRDNQHEGILIEKGERNDSEKADISNSDIVENGWSGIYSKKRKLVIVDCDIKKNEKNGIMFESGVRAWIDNNSVSGNTNSGLVARLDGSDITVSSGNTFRKNGREGIEISSFGGMGSIYIKRSRISENERYGVAKIARKSFPSSVWNGLNVEKTNTYFENGLGNVSSVIRGF